MMIKQQDRTKVLLNIEDYILELVDQLCKNEGFVRNKILERFIREGIKKEFQIRKRNEELEELYSKEKQKLILLQEKLKQFEENEQEKKQKRAAARKE